MEEFRRAPHRLGCAAAGIVAVLCANADPAAAQGYYGWSDVYQDQLYSPERPRPVRRAPSYPRQSQKAEKLAAEGQKPNGPIVIAISIQNQSLKIYDADGLFSQSPISTGMRGHPTPMGVFSVIQKHKWHRSNIYSGAPMPYMQRITWSGVAMHAGELPGYPASHGCIRLPMSFAMKLWNWSRMGARVVVTPGEVAPSEITHSVLAALRPAPASVPNPPEAAAPSVSIKTADASGAFATLPSVTADASFAAEGRAVSKEAPDDGAQPAPVNAALNELPEITMPAEAPSALVAEAVPDAPLKNAARAGQDAEALAPMPAPLPVLGKRSGPIAIFVSRKDAKLYVRQNFTPLFDMPIAIEASDRPLGTHVFTARRAGDDGLRWSAVTMPASARQASLVKEERGSRRRSAPAIVMAAASDNSAAEALGRIAIPSELMARLGDALPQGSSLVISDQGIGGGETGAGTDFIVRLR